MPIQVKTPDGNIAQFPDGMADADIEKVMAGHYPQPSLMDRVAASPVGRFAHDAIAAPLQGLIANLGSSEELMGADVPEHNPAAFTEPVYQGALARNRNTPGYAAARQKADAVMQQRGSGLHDQMFAPLMPAAAGAGGLVGGASLDASNALADSQEAAQQGYSRRHPVLSLGAGFAGGLAMGGPAGAAERLPIYAGESSLLTRAVNPKASGPFPAPPVRTSGLNPGAQEAIDAGYVLPPRMMTEKPGAVADVLSGWSGKIKTQQAASAKNQEITNSLAEQALGSPPGAPLTEQTFKTVRKIAGEDYAAIPKALPQTLVDHQFVSDVMGLGGRGSAVAHEFPDIASNQEIEGLVNSLSRKDSFGTQAGMDLVRQLRNKASANFKAAADPERLELAHAQRGAANAIEDLIERNLTAPKFSYSGADSEMLSETGNHGDLVKNYREARRTIALSHDLESATNTATGNVSARKLAQLANRGRPLSGEIKTIADAANAFPKAFQSEAAFGDVEPLSILDIAGSAASLAHGNPSVAGVLLGRPLARAAVLSKPLQRAVASRTLPPPLLQAPRLNGQIPYGLLSSLPMLPAQSQ